MKNPKSWYIISLLIFGSIGLFVRNIPMSSGQIALVRGIIGSIFLLVASKVLKQKISWKAIRPNFLLLIISGAAIGLNWIFLFEAYKYTSISTATVCYYFAPVFVMFLSPFVLKEHLTIVKILCVITAVIGMFFVVGNGGSTGNNNMIGIGYGLMAAMLYAGVVLMNKFIKAISALETTLLQIGSAAITLIPYVLLTDPIKVSTLNMSTLLLLLYVGMVNTGLAYLLYFGSMKNLKGQTVAVLSYIDPISAITMAFIFLGEKMTLLQLAGGIMILGASFISEMKEKKIIVEDKVNS
jgi:drug/metabolite transporter (DMT)-like permease